MQGDLDVPLKDPDHLAYPGSRGCERGGSRCGGPRQTHLSILGGTEIEPLEPLHHTLGVAVAVDLVVDVDAGLDHAAHRLDHACPITGEGIGDRGEPRP